MSINTIQIIHDLYFSLDNLAQEDGLTSIRSECNAVDQYMEHVLSVLNSGTTQNLDLSIMGVLISRHIQECHPEYIPYMDKATAQPNIVAVHDQLDAFLKDNNES